MKNIIITGGGMVNKGAQAMTLIAVHELRVRFPEHRIFLYSPVDLANKKLDKSQFAFDFTGWYPMKFAHCQRNPLQRAIILLRSRSELLEAEAIYRNTDFIVDISGYALGSNWSDKICNDFLDILEFTQGFNIPVYLMPQSFGPFDFGADRKVLNDRIKKLLPTAKVIFAREQEGYDALVNTYGLTNVRLATDLVLDNMTYFDVNNMVSLLKVPTSFCLALADDVCLPEFVYSAYHHTEAEKEIMFVPFSPHCLPEPYKEFAEFEFAQL